MRQRRVGRSMSVPKREALKHVQDEAAHVGARKCAVDNLRESNAAEGARWLDGARGEDSTRRSTLDFLAPPEGGRPRGDGEPLSPPLPPAEKVVSGTAIWQPLHDCLLADWVTSSYPRWWRPTACWATASAAASRSSPSAPSPDCLC
jgi:hypothetical protein